MKKFNVFICSLILTLIVSTVLPNFAYANELESKESALAESLLYNFNTQTLEFDEEAAKEIYNFTDEELSYYESLESLTPEEVNNTLLTLGIDMENYDGNIIYKEDENGEIQEFAVVAWLAGIGLVSFIGYFFWDRYLTHKEKMNYMDQCFAQGGNPVIDSRDDAGLRGKTSETEAKKIGGYNFACEKPKRD
ncbi:chromosome partitioning protein ParB [Lysinibacillus sp. CTST325]